MLKQSGVRLKVKEVKRLMGKHSNFARRIAPALEPVITRLRQDAQYDGVADVAADAALQALDQTYAPKVRESMPSAVYDDHCSSETSAIAMI